MSKIVKTLLSDYLVTKDIEDLELFVVNVAPDFRLTKKKKEQLISMIAKYEADKKNKTRLDIILNFLGAEKQVKPVKKPADTDTIVIAQGRVVKEQSSVVKEQTPAQKELVAIQEEQREIANSIREAKGDATIINALKVAIKDLDKRMAVAVDRVSAEMKANRDPNQDRIDEEHLLKSIFGDPENENSHAFKILSGKAIKFKIKTSYNPEIMIKKLFRFHNKEPYDFAAGIIDGQNSVWSVKRGSAGVWDAGVTKLGDVQ